MFSLICVWITVWVNNREAGDLRRHRGHHDVIVMVWFGSVFFCLFLLCSYGLMYLCALSTNTPQDSFTNTAERWISNRNKMRQSANHGHQFCTDIHKRKKTIMSGQPSMSTALHLALAQIIHGLITTHVIIMTSLARYSRSACFYDIPNVTIRTPSCLTILCFCLCCPF